MPSPLLAWLAACAFASAGEAELPPVGAPAPCIACRAPATDPRTSFSAQEWATLEGGGVWRATPERSRSQDDLSADTVAVSLVHRPPSEVWAVLTDFEHWPEFMPLLRATHIDRREGSKLWVEQKFSVLLYPMRHTTVYDLAPDDGRLTWQLDQNAPHDIAASEGHWTLTAVDGGKATLIRYQARMSSGRAVPEFVERMLRERSLSQMLDGLRSEVLRRYPQG